MLIIGVNGVGKTTSIGKLANRYKKQGKRVLLCAADTFARAAADQLEIWADRAGVEIVRSREGADPGAVLFDSSPRQRREMWTSCSATRRAACTTRRT